MNAGKKKRSSPDYALLGSALLQQASEPESLSKQAREGEAKIDAGLYIVATPIGNLGDISLRALLTLQQADVVACEDTRTTGALLSRYQISQKLVSYHDHNEGQRLPELLARMQAGEAVALVSDAGTPLISDPGFKLVAAARDMGLPVTAVPGASALLTALASSGLATDRFLFAGFLPPKKAARKTALSEVAHVPATLIFYETAPRLADSLSDMAEVLGVREACVARELTKLFEETRGGTLRELADFYAGQDQVKGEIVIVVGRAKEGQGEEISEQALDDLLRHYLKTESVRDAVAAVVDQTGLKKSAVYNRALELAKK